MTKVIEHSCGWKGDIEDIIWDWNKENMSDFEGYCPGCKKDWHTGTKRYEERWPMLELIYFNDKMEIKDWSEDD